MGGPSDASTFIMASAFVKRWALKAFQSAKTITIELADALISVRYCSFNLSGSSRSVSNVVPMVVVFWSAWFISQWARSASR